ncbi:GNAT family N-acetyltransferase [Spirillospora albida]|uniref:GNAT family N-acetyltransferase n=1 Tax=Spirillospora albida TaxID=58123 RepID=UPI0004C1EC62|nr:GNAT family N-acetyltransferase [Spirillospora albida]
MDIPVTGLAPVRSRLELRLRPVPPPPSGYRPFDPGDAPALGALMWDAYRGTPDEQDARTPEEAAREIRRTLDGAYGAFLPAASYIAVEEERPVAAALVTLYWKLPLLAFLFTSPSHMGRGHGRGLIAAVGHALLVQGHDTLALAVTRRNRRARHLYHRLGFVEVS